MGEEASLGEIKMKRVDEGRRGGREIKGGVREREVGNRKSIRKEIGRLKDGKVKQAWGREKIERRESGRYQWKELKKQINYRRGRRWEN